MQSQTCNTRQNNEAAGFDLVRLTKSKEAVDLCYNTIKAYHRDGLPIYKCAKASFFSKTELDQFIRNRAKG